MRERLQDAFPKEIKSFAVGTQGMLLMHGPTLLEEKTLPQCVTYLPLMALWKISTGFSEVTNEFTLELLMSGSVF